jgi:hypothetical protein
MRRNPPAIAIMIPTSTKMFENRLMSPAGGVRDMYAKNAPSMISANPISFSVMDSPRVTSALMSEPQDFTLQSQAYFNLSELQHSFLSLYCLFDYCEVSGLSVSVEDFDVLFCLVGVAGYEH